jgi:hypothetical protein
MDLEDTTRSGGFSLRMNIIIESSHHVDLFRRLLFAAWIRVSLLMHLEPSSHDPSQSLSKGMRDPHLSTHSLPHIIPLS